MLKTDAANRIRLLMAMLAFLACSRAISAKAEDQPAETSLEEINSKVDQSEKDLLKIAARQAELEAELRTLKLAADDLRSQERNLSKELEQRNTEKQALEAEIMQTGAQIEQIRRFSLKRLRAAYMNRSESVMEKLVALRDNPRLTVNALFLKRIQEFDRAVLSRLAGLQLERDRRRSELQRLLQEQAGIQKALKARSQSLQAKLNRQEAVVREIKLQKTAVQQMLTQLRAQALRLETVVASLTGAREDLPAAPERPGSAEAGEPSEDRVDERRPFEGAGIKAQIRSLVLPVEGRVLQRFGKQRPTEFEDFVASKGLDFEARDGADVLAIAPGRVMFMGQMPHFGTVLILDHGKRSYSLYGRLGEISAHQGDIVSGGQKIASAGAADQKGRNFYFEIRERGKTVNPEEYFRGL